MPRVCAISLCAAKNAIADTDIYDPKQELRLDERQLTAALGVSRTPIREPLAPRAGRIHSHHTASRYLHHSQVEARND